MAGKRIDTVYFDLGDTIVTRQRKWVPGGKAALKTLGLSGVRLGIISNTGTLTRQQLLQLLPADFNMGVFKDELVILSSEAGVEKPAAQIYGLAVDRANVAPCNIVFCGEKLSEVLAAQQLGIRGLQVAISTNADDVVTESSVLDLARQIVKLNDGS